MIIDTLDFHQPYLLFNQLDRKTLNWLYLVIYEMGRSK